MKTMQNIQEEIVPLIEEVCMALTGHANENEVALMLGTAAAESSLLYKEQVGGGPARGLWQMEPETALDIFENHLLFPAQSVRLANLVKLWLGLDHITWFAPHYFDLSYSLEEADDFACAMARIHYLRVPDAIPVDLVGQARYWKQCYNTPAGAGTIKHYLDQWEACHCADLLDKYGG